jgi:hypothetical protein
MSADCCDTSDPEMPIAMPISALLSAGASLTPSPVTATAIWCFSYESDHLSITNLSESLTPFDYLKFLRRRCSSKDNFVVVVQDIVQFVVGYVA